MTPKVHFTVSLMLGLVFGFIFQSYLIGILSLVIGWLIDCDHFLDYFLYLLKFKTKPSLKEFFSPGIFCRKLGKIYVLAHGWEYLFLFLILGFWKLNLPFVIAIGSVYGLHLALDQLANRTRPLMYFLLYRIKNGFDVNKLCPLDS